MDIEDLINKHTTDDFLIEWKEMNGYYKLITECRLTKPKSVRGGMYEWSGKEHIFLNKDIIGIEKCILEHKELQNGRKKDSSTENKEGL